MVGSYGYLYLATINLFSYNKGDYRTKWVVNFEDLSLWEYYNGSDGKMLLIAIFSFANTIYINTQNIAIHTSIIIEGGLVITGTLQLYSELQ
jgi:hypothetical protein